MSASPLPTRRCFPARTRSDRRLERLFDILARSPAQAHAVALVPAVFVQAMLPHRRPRPPGPGGKPDATREADRYTRCNGHTTLTVTAGRITHPDGQCRALGVPYGGLARLLLAHLCTEARRLNTRHLDLGPSFAAFLRTLDITPSGGTHGRRLYVHDQLLRLATAHLHVQSSRPAPDGTPTVSGHHLPLTRSYHLWHPSVNLRVDEPENGRNTSTNPLSPHSPHSATKSLTLSADFYAALCARAVPVDARKLQYLRHHPLAMDLYCWCTHRAWTLARAGHAHCAVSWCRLNAQLGSHYASPKAFARKARCALTAVRTLWPALDVDTPRGRLVLRTTRPDVHPGTVRLPKG